MAILECKKRELVNLSKTDVENMGHSIIDGDIVYEIAAQIGNSFVLDKGKNSITLKEDYEQCDMCAIKAYSVENSEIYNYC